jgi:hypothetical protein
VSEENIQEHLTKEYQDNTHKKINYWVGVFDCLELIQQRQSISAPEISDEEEFGPVDLTHEKPNKVPRTRVQPQRISEEEIIDWAQVSHNIATRILNEHRKHSKTQPNPEEWAKIAAAKIVKGVQELALSKGLKPVSEERIHELWLFHSDGGTFSGSMNYNDFQVAIKELNNE